MTLSIGNHIRKWNTDGSGPVENEGHVLFEVTRIFSGYDPEKQASVQLVEVRPIE